MLGTAAAGNANRTRHDTQVVPDVGRQVIVDTRQHMLPKVGKTNKQVLVATRYSRQCMLRCTADSDTTTAMLQDIAHCKRLVTTATATAKQRIKNLQLGAAGSVSQTLEAEVRDKSGSHVQNMWPTCVAHVIQAGMRSTHSP